jgi:hypothetical protein
MRFAVVGYANADVDGEEDDAFACQAMVGCGVILSARFNFCSGVVCYCRIS